MNKKYQSTEKNQYPFEKLNVLHRKEINVSKNECVIELCRSVNADLYAITWTCSYSQIIIDGKFGSRMTIAGDMLMCPWKNA